jgi:cobaltochelatase CobN
MRITAIIGDYTYSKTLSDVSDRLRKMFHGEVSLRTHFCLRHQSFAERQLSDLEDDIKNTEIILLNMVFDEPVIDLIEKFRDGKTIIIMASTPRGLKLTQMGRFRLGEVAEAFEDSKVAKVLAIFRGLTGMKSKMEMRKMLTMADSLLKILRFGKWKDARNYIQTWKYLYGGGFENILNLFLLILSEYYNYSVKVKPPAEIPPNLIVHPKADRYFTSLEDYLKWYKAPEGLKINGSKKKPFVGILFYQMRYQNKDTEDLMAVIEKLEHRGIGVVPVIPEVSGCADAFKKHFMGNGKAKVDAIISFLYFRLEGGPLGGDYEAFEKMCRQLNVTIINYLSMGYLSKIEWTGPLIGLLTGLGCDACLIRTNA